MHPILVHNLHLSDILLRLDNRHIYVHLLALFVQIWRRSLFGEIHRWLLLFFQWVRIICDGEVLMLLLLVRLLLIIFILVIVVSLFVLFLILRLLLNLAEVLQLLLIVLYKLIIIAIPLSDFLNLIWVNLHMIQYYWLDIIVIFLHDIFV